MIEQKAKSIMMICYVFPPLAYAGTHRSIRLCRYLKRLGYEISVITININDRLQNDPGLLSKVKDDCVIYRTRTIDPLNMYRPIKKKLLATKVGRILDKAASLIVKYICQPDHMVFWIPFSFMKAVRIIRKKKQTIVYTSSPPHSEHLIGYLLKRIFGIVWIADLRDPIMDNMIAVNFGFIEKLINKQLEKIIVKNANTVISNCASARNSLQRRYGAKNVKSIYNSFDEADFDVFEPDKFSKFTIAHVGSIYGPRKVDLLLEGIYELHKRCKITSDTFKLMLIGINDNYISNLIKSYGIQNYVEIRKPVSHSEALKLMQRAHLLLLVKGFGENSENQIPGKLFEYIGSGRKILYIGPDDNEVADILRSFELGYIINGNKNQLCEVILNEINNSYKVGNVVKKPDAINLRRFTSSAMAEKFDRLIRKLLEKNY